MTEGMLMDEKTGKVAVVTGSTKGIGRAIALALLERGFTVIANYGHDDAAAARLEEEAKRSPDGRLRLVRMDLSTPDSADAFAEAVLELEPAVDVVVLNAGITIRKGFTEMTHEEYRRIMDTNLNVPYFILQRLHDHMRRDGRVILVGGGVGIYPHATVTPYGLSKAGMNYLAGALVKEFKDVGVTVNTIAPGFTETDWQSGKTPEVRKRINGKIAAGRFAEPEEIAGMAMAIVDNGYVNGSVLKVDGGYGLERG